MKIRLWPVRFNICGGRHAIAGLESAAEVERVAHAYLGGHLAHI